MIYNLSYYIRYWPANIVGGFAVMKGYWNSLVKSVYVNTNVHTNTITT